MSNKTVEAKELWEKTVSIMTIAVSKNLKIEDDVSKALGSNYNPYHLLCKSHLVEGFDR